MAVFNKKISLRESFQKNGVWYFLLLLFAANMFIWYAVFSEERGSTLTVAFLDVGQGDAIFIEAPNGNQILIDGGAGPVVLRALSRVMPFYDRTIDVVLATHPDKDHIGGLPDVLRRYKVNLFVESGAEGTSAISQELRGLTERSGMQKIVARRGMKLALAEDVYMLVLFPDRDVSGMDTNDASIVAKLVYGNTSFLFTGDSPQKIEKYLSSLDGGALNVDVLKVGHHGSDTSSSDVFIGFTSPAYAVISAGKDNSYGHPHKAVLSRLGMFGSVILRTDERGTVIFKSDGEALTLR